MKKRETTPAGAAELRARAEARLEEKGRGPQAAGHQT